MQKKVQKSVDKATFLTCLDMVRKREIDLYLAAACCGLSKPTFALRGCQYLHIYDEPLPEWFFDGWNENYKKAKLCYHTEEELEAVKEEVKRRIDTRGYDISDVTSADGLPFI